MELGDAVRRRSMTRSFSEAPVDHRAVERLLAAAAAAPSAGNTRGTTWVVLEGPAETATYWTHATTERWRQRSSRFDGLSRAPVVLLSLTSPRAYVDRYRAPDKAASGLGQSEEAWPVPYWYGDAAFEVMTVLLAATSMRLGACFLGAFRGGPTLLRALEVPEEWRWFGTVLIGHPDGRDHPSTSLDRRPPTTGRPHFGGW